MHDTSTHPRRGFLAGLFGVAAAASLPSVAAAQVGGGDAWIKEVPGKYRCFFDCPQHMNGFGLSMAGQNDRSAGIGLEVIRAFDDPFLLHVGGQWEFPSQRFGLWIIDDLRRDRCGYCND